MSASPKSSESATVALRNLAGKTVLVKSSSDQRNPPTAMRGTIEVQEHPGEEPRISLRVDFPQMFTTRAHQRYIPLDHETALRLGGAEGDGPFEYTIDAPLT